MIGKLRGKIDEVSAQGIVLDVGGVGYDVTVPLATLAKVAAVGKETQLWIHTYVREDDLRLYGFSSSQDRAAFRTMLKISGVGPKLALAVLGAMSGNQLAEVIRVGDAKRLSAIPGIGKKTAERIILELGGKLLPKPGEGGTVPNPAFSELSSALKNLGFKNHQVDQVLSTLEKCGEKMPFEEMLRRALALLQEK